MLLFTIFSSNTVLQQTILESKRKRTCGSVDVCTF